mmetsp:Transcript_158940/g.289812  ORF Transcript_158940/g.289812 Transcript_158940/m.289812 type:complete len:206 (+) Transcript_158940:29-646(+)
MQFLGHSWRTVYAESCAAPRSTWYCPSLSGSAPLPLARRLGTYSFSHAWSHLRFALLPDLAPMAPNSGQASSCSSCGGISSSSPRRSEALYVTGTGWFSHLAAEFGVAPPAVGVWPPISAAPAPAPPPALDSSMGSSSDAPPQSPHASSSSCSTSSSFVSASACGATSTFSATAGGAVGLGSVAGVVLAVAAAPWPRSSPPEPPL